MKKKIIIFVLALAGLKPYTHCFGQIRATPAAVSDNFASMFPSIKDVDWRDKQVDFQAFFSLNGMKCEAKFTVDGKWISTERQIIPDSLPKAVQEGFKVSKFGAWSIVSTFMLNFPDKSKQYRIVATDGESNKKLLSFNQDGRLVEPH